jgi:hypothetical protein
VTSEKSEVSYIAPALDNRSNSSKSISSSSGGSSSAGSILIGLNSILGSFQLVDSGQRLGDNEKITIMSSFHFILSIYQLKQTN